MRRARALRIARARRRALAAKRAFIVMLVAFVAFGATAAAASWVTAGSGSGTSAGTTLGAPTSATAATISSTSIKLTWAAPSSGPAPTQYIVKRTAPTTATVCTVGAPTVTCNDTGLTGSTTYSYTIQSMLGTNWTSATSAASATTSAPPTLKVALAVAGSKTAGTAFNVTLTATTNGVTTDTTYTGTKTITFSGPSNSPSGSAPVYPASVTFASGVGTATNITLKAAETATLGATDGTISGSTSVTVVAGAQNQLQFTSSSMDCSSGSVTVGNGGSWTTKVSVYDAYLNPKSGTARTVTLTRAPTSGAWVPTTLGILAANVESTSSATYTRAAGNTDVTVTAAISPLVSDTCVVKK